MGKIKCFFKNDILKYGLIISLLSLSDSLAQTLTSQEKVSITYETTAFISELEALMNIIASTSMSQYDRDLIKENSFIPSANQLFLNDNVIIEDDIDPYNYGQSKKTKDLKVARYLNDLDLFYNKSNSKSIFFSNIKTSEIKQKKYIFLEVYFESQFTGKHITKNKSYLPTKRVATLIVQKKAGNWQILIASIVHYNASKHTFVYQSKKASTVNTSITNKETLQKTSKKRVALPIPTKPHIIKERVLALGANVGFGFGFNQASVGANAQTYLADYLVADFLFNYFANQKFEETIIKRWSLDANANYVFEIDGADKIPYAIIGMNLMKYTSGKLDDGQTVDITSSTYLGLNIGTGIEFVAQKNMVYFGQLKYTTGRQSHVLLTVGFRFKFKT